MKILTKWLRSYVPGIPVDDHQLAADLTLRGIAVEGMHALGDPPDGHVDGHLFEMDITTNRVDAMNHYGVAREAATIYGLPLASQHAAVAGSPAARAFPVAIDPAAKELCGRFTGRVLRDVPIAPSSGRVAHYFELLGLKQISNAVDASNFVLQGMGHPTHAFDLDKIEGGILVRLARAGEKLKLLDGSELTLAADDLVIADHRKALSLAGVMGGWDSMITPATRNILVESAWFDPAIDSPLGPPPRTAYRCLAPLRTGRRLQRSSNSQRACVRAHPRVGRLRRRRADRRRDTRGAKPHRRQAPNRAFRPTRSATARIYRRGSPTQHRRHAPLGAHRRIDQPIPHVPRLPAHAPAHQRRTASWSIYLHGGSTSNARSI